MGNNDDRLSWWRVLIIILAALLLEFSFVYLLVWMGIDPLG